MQPPCLCKVHLPVSAVAVQLAEQTLRFGVALRYTEPEQPPRLGNVCWTEMVAEEHDAESALRIDVTLFCFKP
jgi:hypothetical protein